MLHKWDVIQKEYEPSEDEWELEFIEKTFPLGPGYNIISPNYDIVLLDYEGVNCVVSLLDYNKEYMAPLKHIKAGQTFMVKCEYLNPSDTLFPGVTISALANISCQ